MKKASLSAQGFIQKTAVPVKELRFSFKFFDSSDSELCPADFREGYTQILMNRLQSISSWTVTAFTTRVDSSLRNHKHDWTKTSRPEGFSKLNSYYRSFDGWQFQLTSNEHGRVHGIIIDDTFYVIWLDHDHRLYPAD